MTGNYQAIRDNLSSNYEAIKTILIGKGDAITDDVSGATTINKNLESVSDYHLVSFLAQNLKNVNSDSLSDDFKNSVMSLHRKQNLIAEEYSNDLKVYRDKDENKDLNEAQKTAIVQLVEANLTLGEIFVNLSFALENAEGEKLSADLANKLTSTFFGDEGEGDVQEFIQEYQAFCRKYHSTNQYKNQITDVYAAFTKGATLSEHWLTDLDFKDFFGEGKCPPILSWEDGESVIKEGNKDNDFIIINLGRSHWICAVKEEGENKYTVYDSLAPNNNFDKYNNNKIALALQNSLNLQKLPELTLNHTGLQQDGYSCGTHVINHYQDYKNNKGDDFSIKVNKTENQKPNDDNNEDEASVYSNLKEYFPVSKDTEELTHADVVATILNNKLESEKSDVSKMLVASYESLKSLYEQCSDEGQYKKIENVLSNYEKSDDYKVLSAINSYQIPTVESESGMNTLIEGIFGQVGIVKYEKITENSDKSVSGYKATFEIDHKDSKGEYQLKQEVVEGGKSVTTLSSNVVFNDFKDQAFKLFQPLSPSILNQNQSLAELKDLSDNDLNAIMKKMLQQGHVTLKLPDSVSGDNAKSYFEDLLNKGAYIQLLNKDESYIKALDAAKKEVYGNSKNKSVKTIGEKIENWEGQQLFKEIIQNYKFKGGKATTSTGFRNDINDFKPMDKAEFKKCLFGLCKKTGRVESYFADRLCQKLNTGLDGDKLKDYLGIDKSWINITPEQLRAQLNFSEQSLKIGASGDKNTNIFQIESVASKKNEVKKDEINENTR